MRLATKGTETENLFEALANNSPVGLCIIQDGKFCYTNPTFQSNTGYREDELLGRDSLEIVFPEDREQARINAIKMLKGERTSPYQFRVTHKDGSIHWVIESVASIKYRGRPATLGNFVDITEHKQAEEVLQAEKNKLQSLIDTLEDHITIRDRDYNLIYMAEHAKKLWGDRTGEKCYRVLEGQDKVCDGCPAEKSFKDGKPHISERQTVTPSGEVLFWETRANPIKDAEGRIVSCLEIARNITGRKQAAEALQAEKNKLQSLIDSIEYTVTIQDPEYNIIYQNEPSRIASGGDYLGEKCYRAYESREKICDGCPVEEAFKDGKPYTAERQRVTPSGEVTFWENTASPIRDAQGRIVACLELARDITTRKQAEESLQGEKNKLQSLIDALEYTLSIQDPEYNIIYQNEPSRTTYGDHLGEKCYRVYEGKEKVCDGCPVKKAFKDGNSHTTEKQRVMPSGEVAFWEHTANPTRDAKGRIVSCLTLGRNITERKKQEQALADEATRRHLLIDQSLDGIVVLDVDAKVVEANQRFAEMLGYTMEEVRELHTWDWDKNFPPEKILEMGRNVDEKGLHLETKHTRKDGSAINVDISINASMFGGQKLIFCVCRDITARNQAEEALKTERNKLQSLIDALADGFSIQDRDYNIIFQNEPSRKTTAGAHTGEKCHRVFEGRDKVCDGCPVEKAFKDGKPHIAERQRILPSGEVTFWENTANPIRDAKGRVVACLEIGRNITERKKAEEALNLQRAYFQQLFDTSPDAIIMMDTNDRAIQVNKGFEKLFGYSNEEAKGRSLIELIVPEEDVKEASKSLKRILDGEAVRKERVRRRKDGSLVDVSVLAYPIRSNGKLVGAYGIYTDITERKKQEQALADELTRRRLLVDQSSDGIVVLDVDARVVEANQRFAEMLGYTMEEVRELHTWDWDKNFPPEKILEIGRNVDKKGLHLETKHTRKDGSVIDVDISISAIMYRGQKLIFCIQRDVTERKKMAEALKLAAEEWRKTFDSISDGVSIHDRDFRIQRANKAFADIFQTSLNQVIGKHCYELHKGKKPRSGCPHQQTLTTGKPTVAEFYESNLGKYLLESTSPLFNEKGEVIGTVHITRDITERKQQNERLMMADRLASVGELAAGTAHELNNPLTSVIGFSQLLMEKDVPDDIREDVKFIYDEAQRAANVTKNLLTFARKRAPVKQLTQINNTIEDVLKLRAYEQKVNSIEVKRRLDPDLPEIMVDYFQMQQVFLNIIINAEYFMTEAHKGGTLTITTQKQNGTVKISFADDGPGIPPENLNRIFDPFFTTKEAGKGTGLGLSICHGMVTEHGGQIYAKSQPGKGATIVVELPVNTP